MIQRLLSDIEDACTTVPEALREHVCAARVRVNRGGRDAISLRVEPCPSDPTALAPVLAELATKLEPGDRVRVEYLNGEGAAVPRRGAGPALSWTVAIDVADRPASPLPSPSVSPSGLAPRSDATAPLRSPTPEIPAGQEGAAVLGAGMQQLAASLAAALELAQRGVALGERGMTLAERTNAGLVDAHRASVTEGARVGAAYANAHGRTTEALATTAAGIGKANADALKGTVETVNDANATLTGMLDVARDREVEAVRAEERAKAGAPPEPAPEGDDGESGRKNAEGTIKAVTELVGEVRAGIKDATGKAAEEAIEAAIGELVDGKTDGTLAQRLKARVGKLGPAERAKAGAALATLLAPS
jgi:hypothetical protein